MKREDLQHKAETFFENVWQRGPSGFCGRAWILADWGAGRTGNVWSGNRWDDGTLIPNP